MYNDDDLFTDCKITEQKDKLFPHRRQCKHCYLWFETTSNYADRCPEHEGRPERKLIRKVYGINDLPFK